MIVEDEAILAMVTSRTLKSFGFDVITANNGELAIEIALNNANIDLVLMDIDLGPGIDGSEAARRILTKRHMPIIFLTSHSEEEYVNKVKKITRYGYVIKGSNNFVLRESIQMAFELFDKHEESLRSEQALKSISQGVLISDINRKIIEANDAFVTMTGYTKEEVIGKTCSFLQGAFTSQNTIHEIRNALNNQIEFAGEILNYKKNGEAFWNELTISPVLNDLGELINFIGVTRDVTDRRQMLENFRLRDESVLFNNVFQFVPFALGITTIKYGNFISVNKAFEELFGYQENEIIGKTSAEINLWVNLAQRDLVMDRFKFEKKIRDFETRLRSKSGTIYWISYSAEILEINGVSCLLSGAIDISLRKSQEHEKEIETQILEIVARGGELTSILSKLVLGYEELFPDTVGSILLLDETGKYLTHGAAPNLPKAYCDLINGLEIGPQAGSCGTAAYTKKVIMVSDIEQDPLWQNYKSFVAPYGLKSCWSMPILGITGKVLGTFAFYSHNIRSANDIELASIERGAHLASIAIERNISSSILNESQNRFKTLFDQAAVGVAELDTRTGKFIRINKKYCEILGYTTEEMLDLDFMTITHPDSLEEDVDGMKRLIDGEVREYSVEKQYICKDKNVRWVHLTVSPLWEPGNKPDFHIAIVQEISERKHHENKINSLLKEKEILLREIHHRIKNNMSVVHSLLDLQAGSLKEPTAIEALTDASSRIQSMSLLYDKLYLSPNFKSMSTSEYLPELIDEILANFHQSKQIKIEKNIEEFILPSEILQPLGIIINELLTNIMKYAFKSLEDGMIKIDIKLENANVIASVSDNGIGIPDSINFDKSSGFGISLINMLSMQLHGILKIERKNGTTVTLVFPYEQ